MIYADKMEGQNIITNRTWNFHCSVRKDFVDDEPSIILHVGICTQGRYTSNPGGSCDSFNQLGKKFVTCLVASFARAHKRSHLDRIASHCQASTDDLDSRILLVHLLLAATRKPTSQSTFFLCCYIVPP